MFKPNRLIFRVTPEGAVRIKDAQDLIDVAGHFPAATDVSIQRLDAAKSGDAIRELPQISHLVVFLDPKDPKAILHDKIFGPHLTAYESCFRTGVDGETTLSQNPLQIPVAREGGVTMLYITMGAGVKGVEDMEDTEFTLPFAWRDAIGKGLKGVIDDVTSKRLTQKDKPQLGIYLNGEHVLAPTSESILKAMGQAVGNMRRRTDEFYTAQKSEIVDTAGLQADAPQEEAPKEKVEIDPAEVTSDVRKSIGEIILLHSVPEHSIEGGAEALDKTEVAILAAYKEGDMVSRMKILTQALAECEYDIMKSAVLVRVLASLVKEAKEKGANINMEIVGPNPDALASIIDFDFITFKSFDQAAQDVGIKQFGGILGVHQGTNQATDPGPYIVTIDYIGDPESNEFNGSVAKGIVEDTGGQNHKPSGIEEMMGDMGATAIKGSIIGRVGEERPKVNMKLVATIASNHIGPDAYVPGRRLELASGRTIEVLNTDAEGRLVVCDGMTYAMRQAKAKGQKLSMLDSAATLTGAAIQSHYSETPIVGKSRTLLHQTENAANANGERVVALPRLAIDKKGVRKPGGHGNLTNLSSLPITKGRGVTTAAQIIAEGSGLDDNAKLAHDSIHWDVAGGVLEGGPAIPADMQGAQFPVEAPLNTMYKRWTTSKQKA